MVYSRVRGTKDKNLKTEVGCRSVVPIIYLTIIKHLVPVICSTGTTGDVAASGSSLMLPRAAADTRGQYICKAHSHTYIDSWRVFSCRFLILVLYRSNKVRPLIYPLFSKIHLSAIGL
jgi:hypothetical protein